MNRRDFILASSATGAGIMGGLTLPSCVPTARRRPRIYLSGSGRGGLVTPKMLAASITSGHSRKLWDRLLHQANTEIDTESILATSMVPGRDPVQAELANPDFLICDAVGKRVTRNALAYLVTNNSDYRSTAVRQIEAVIDPDVWPDWIDQAHLRYELPAGLRTGMLAFSVGVGFDWLYGSLSREERNSIVDGLDRRAIQPFLTSLEQDPWWIHDVNNWTTTIVGGLGICGMAIDGEHPDSPWLIEYARQTMETYLEIYGPEGEFNECPAYANATLRPVEFYMAMYYWSGGGEKRIAEHPFPETCYWLKYLTLPPGRVAAFGDSKVDGKPWMKHVAAVAAANEDGVLQQFYLDHADEDGDAIELLWYDASLSPETPEVKLPLAKSFPAHGGCFVSRSSWDTRSADCIVYGKAGREENHEHHDAGQVCIDACGERLITDLGGPPSYPADFFEIERWKYYNAGIVGHNVLMFDGQAMIEPVWERGQGRKLGLDRITGRIVHAETDDARGEAWILDLTKAYAGAKSVRRVVVHLLPGFAAVLDTAELDAARRISLRWHTADVAAPDRDGSFAVSSGEARLSARIVDVGSGRPRLARREHRYVEPFDRDRHGALLEQRNESYVEATATSNRCRWLTLFATGTAVNPPGKWASVDDGFSCRSGNDVATCSVRDDQLILRAESGEWVVPLA